MKPYLSESFRISNLNLGLQPMKKVSTRRFCQTTMLHYFISYIKVLQCLCTFLLLMQTVGSERNCSLDDNDECHMNNM